MNSDIIEHLKAIREKLLAEAMGYDVEANNTTKRVEEIKYRNISVGLRRAATLIEENIEHLKGGVI